MEHSILPPSSAARRVLCPGSRALEAAMPQVDTVAIREGIDAHSDAAAILRNAILHPKYEPKLFEDYSERNQAINFYVEYILKHIKEHKNEYLAEIFIEQKVEMPDIHKKSWGTLDCALYSEQEIENIIHIFDFKYGHTYVEVYENWQLILYAAGIFNEIKNRNKKPIYFIFHIVQPRCYTAERARTWKISAKDLEPYFEKLRKTEKLSMRDDAPLIPSAKACQYCKAVKVCPALKKQTKEISEKIITGNQTNWENEQELANEITFLKEAAALLESRLNALTQEAISLIELGNRVPGYRIEQSAGREVWKKPVGEIIALGELYGINLKKPTDVITPTQAIKAKLDEKIVHDYSERKRGENKLVCDDARKIFGGKNDN